MGVNRLIVVVVGVCIPKAIPHFPCAPYGPKTYVNALLKAFLHISVHEIYFDNLANQDAPSSRRSPSRVSLRWAGPQPNQQPSVLHSGFRCTQHVKHSILDGLPLRPHLFSFSLIFLCRLPSLFYCYSYSKFKRIRARAIDIFWQKDESRDILNT
jgi:hypothetical protein